MAGTRGTWRASAARAISDYLKALDSGRVEQDLVVQVLGAFETLVKNRLRRRGLWSQPARWLGGGGAPLDQDRDFFDGLVRDLYAGIFHCKRWLACLARHAHAGPDRVLRLVVRAVDQILTQRQGRHDPIGTHVYRSTLRSIRRLQAEGFLRCSMAPRTRRNTMRMSLGPDGPSAHLGAGDLETLIMGDPTWPGLAIRLGRGLPARDLDLVIVRLSTGQAVEVTLGDLMTVFKRHVRQAARLAGGMGLDMDSSSLDACPEPAVVQLSGDEAGPSLDEWRRRLLEAVQARSGTRKVREKLGRLVDLLVDAVRHDRPVQQLDWCRQLGINPKTMSDDMRSLRTLTQQVDRS